MVLEGVIHDAKGDNEVNDWLQGEVFDQVVVNVSGDGVGVRFALWSRALGKVPVELDNVFYSFGVCGGGDFASTGNNGVAGKRVDVLRNKDV